MSIRVCHLKDHTHKIVPIDYHQVVAHCGYLPYFPLLIPSLPPHPSIFLSLKKTHGKLSVGHGVPGILQFPPPLFPQAIF